MIGYVLTAAFFYLLSKSKKRKPSLGELPGTRITRSELIRKIRRGETGNVNNGDFYFDGGFLYSLYDEEQNKRGKIYQSDKELKEAISETLEKNQNHLRAKKTPSKFFSFDEYFGFNKIEPIDERDAYYFTILAIANGLKFIWEDQGVRTGLENELFGRKTPAEKKYYKGIISKKGTTIEELNEHYSLKNDFRAAITEAVKDANCRTAAKQILDDEYTMYLYDNLTKETAYKEKEEEEEETDGDNNNEDTNKNFPFVPINQKSPF